ncbi:MAG TPA: hypothetical protein VGM29_18910 [Polyangiaceae bacterium]|jgi:hypothetical protein
MYGFRRSSRSLQALGFVGGFVALALSATPIACKKKAPPPAAKPLPELPDIAPDEGSVEPPQAAKAAPMPACRSVLGVALFRIGEESGAVARGEPTADDEAGTDDQDDVPLPFSTEVGDARADATGFAAGALRSAKGNTHALLALIPSAAPALKLIDLGAVHGDPDPPAFAVHGADMVVAASDTDAGGAMLRLGVVHDALGVANVTWGAELTGVRRDSPFALEVSGARALLVFASVAHDKVRLLGASFSVDQVPAKLATEPVSPGDADVDEPRLAPRNGGFWLASARALPTDKGKGKATPAPAPSADESDPSLVEDVARRIELTQLDGNGKPLGAALALSTAGESVMTFNLAAAADGSAYVAFRTDDTTPGADGGPLRLVHVKLDGTLERLPVEGDEQGSGAPTLLVDAASGTLWLVASGSTGATWFGKVGPKTELHTNDGVRGASLLGIQAGHWLSERARGTAAELSLLECPSG